jgi:PPK2 family polyphosphate:nucleotide phosphotransferase
VTRGDEVGCGTFVGMSDEGITREHIEGTRWTGGRIDLHERPTSNDGLYESKQQYVKLLREEQERLRKLQRRLFVQGAQAMLIILQGLDTSGKDGIIRHVMRGFNPQGCRVYSFGPPNNEEIHHDFLWRTTRHLPERGRIAVFNRSEYEEVLVVRVHPELLAPQHVDVKSVEDGSIWTQRYEAIRAHEQHLLASGTHIVKLMLHVSAEAQADRLLSRLTNPAKNWKFNESDVEERQYREDYLKAYSECISATATLEAPWYVVPADDKRSARLLAGAIIIEALERMDLEQPEVSIERAAELAKIREELEEELPTLTP